MSLIKKSYIAIGLSLIILSVIQAGYLYWTTPTSRTFTCRRSTDKAGCIFTKHYLRGNESFVIQQSDIRSVTQTHMESYSGRWGTPHMTYNAVVMLNNGLTYDVIKSVDDPQPVSLAAERIKAYLADPSSPSLSVGY